MAQLTSLPGRLDWTIWPDQEERIILTWPAGHLDTAGPWTATLTISGETPIALTVAISGDEMTITLPAGATSGLTHRIGQLVITDDGRDRIAGTVRITDSPGPSTTEAAVTIEDQSVTVDLVGDPALSAALDTHEADETAHGTVSSDSTTIVHSIGSSPVITQTPLQVSPVPGAVVTVPDLPDKVWLYGKAIVDPLAPLPDTLADVEADQDGMQLSIAVASTDPIGLDTVLDSSHAPVMWNGSGIVCMVELDPHSPGDYQLFATRTNGDLRILTPDHARARIGWFRTRPPFA